MLRFHLIICFLFQLSSLPSWANETLELQTKTEQALSDMLQKIEKHYAYQKHKDTSFSCLQDHYSLKIKTINTRGDAVLFFEHLLLEFADSHMTLNTNTQDSYRLNSPLTVVKSHHKFIVDDYWQSQLIHAGELIIGAELLSINGMLPEQVIKQFPTSCLDKSLTENQQWIINKSLAGQYAKPRVIELSVLNNPITINLDQLKYHQSQQLLSAEIIDGVGIIRINNALGQTELISAFDQTINDLSQSKAIVLDLRNTISGGDSYIARAIIGRFIEQEQPYQIHRFEERRNGGPSVTRLWTEFVSPRLPTYKKPLVVLVNRWTGSMGEGLAIGLHGMHRSEVIGTPMAGLLGAVYGFQLEGLGFGYQMPGEQLFHVDGTPRESFMPDQVVKPSSKDVDAVLQQGINWLQQQNDNQTTNH